MKKPLLISGFMAILALMAFLGISVSAKLFKDADLPVQVMGAFLGAIVTAFITLILLSGQSQAEETKERNVKVFEERIKNYNVFIEKLWEVWADRSVDLQETSELLEMFTKHIVLFTHQKTSEKILHCLNDLAALAKSDHKKPVEGKDAQSIVFEIVDLLARQIGLGGRIGEKESIAIREIEKAILPYLEERKVKAAFLETLSAKVEAAEPKLLPGRYGMLWNEEYILFDWGNSGVSLGFGPVNYKDNKNSWLFFYADYYKHKEYQPRAAAKGNGKDCIGQFERGAIEALNFADPQQVETISRELGLREKGDGPGYQETYCARLGDAMIKFAVEFRAGGKDIGTLIGESKVS
jgi:hypothetical protein